MRSRRCWPSWVEPMRLLFHPKFGAVSGAILGERRRWAQQPDEVWTAPPPSPRQGGWPGARAVPVLSLVLLAWR